MKMFPILLNTKRKGGFLTLFQMSLSSRVLCSWIHGLYWRLKVPICAQKTNIHWSETTVLLPTCKGKVNLQSFLSLHQKGFVFSSIEFLFKRKTCDEFRHFFFKRVRRKMKSLYCSGVEVLRNVLLFKNDSTSSLYPRVDTPSIVFWDVRCRPEREYPNPMMIIIITIIITPPPLPPPLFPLPLPRPPLFIVRNLRKIHDLCHDLRK